MPKVKKSSGGGRSGAGMALADQILQADAVPVRSRTKSRDDRAESEDKYVDERLSRKILQQARIQQEELQTEYGLAPEKKKQPLTVLGRFNRLEPYYGDKPAQCELAGDPALVALEVVVAAVSDNESPEQ